MKELSVAEQRYQAVLA
ncbi:transposase, partial [Mycobacterium tuberculosis BTB04-120]